METVFTDIERSFAKMQNSCKLFKKLFEAGFWIALFCGVIICLWGVFGIESLELLLVVGTLIPSIVRTIFVMVLLKIGSFIFGDICKGMSPFSTRQANRIRQAAVVFVLFAIFNTAWSPDVVSYICMGDVSFGVWNEQHPFVFHVDTGMLVASVLFLSLSMVFRYGTLLQCLSDETV